MNRASRTSEARQRERRFWPRGPREGWKAPERTKLVARAVDETRFPSARNTRETELGYVAIINLELKDRRPRAGPFSY
jgi:hypothetical protein